MKKIFLIFAILATIHQLYANPLHTAILNNDLQDLKKILYISSKSRILFTLINEKNNTGSTPLHLAVNSQNIEMVKTLLIHSGSIDTKELHSYVPLRNMSDTCDNLYKDPPYALIEDAIRTNFDHSTFNKINKNREVFQSWQKKAASLELLYNWLSFLYFYRSIKEYILPFDNETLSHIKNEFTHQEIMTITPSSVTTKNASACDYDIKFCFYFNQKSNF